MRDRIARALVWVLSVLLPARGRHAATSPTARTPHVICAPTAPITLVVPSRGQLKAEYEGPRIPPYLRAWIERQEDEIERQRQRCVALVAASMGYHYPNPERHDMYAAVSA